MRRFLYYIPGVGGANSRMLSDRGLVGRFTAGGGNLIEHGCTPVMEGPRAQGDSSPQRIGCIVAAGARPPKYEPEKQRWTFSTAFAVGLEDASLPPGPADLERDNGVAGYPIRLADGNEWRIPLIQRWDPTLLKHVSCLPGALVGELIDGKYLIATKLLPQFDSLDQKATTIFRAFVDRATVPLSDLFATAADLLNVNYRIHLEEISLMGLLTEKLVFEVLELAIDMPSLRRCGQELKRRGLIARQTPRPVPEKEFSPPVPVPPCDVIADGGNHG